MFDIDLKKYNEYLETLIFTRDTTIKLFVQALNGYVAEDFIYDMYKDYNIKSLDDIQNFLLDYNNEIDWLNNIREYLNITLNLELPSLNKMKVVFIELQEINIQAYLSI